MSVSVLYPAAAQKLSGKVRIANVRFSESFRNASSTEYRAFVDLFSRTVSQAGIPDPGEVRDGGQRLGSSVLKEPGTKPWCLGHGHTCPLFTWSRTASCPLREPPPGRL